MDVDTVKQAYSRWAGVYDWVFGPLFAEARSRAIERLGLAPGDRVLEVGVGTGLSLPLYPRDVRVAGIDISAAMLRRAAERLRREDGIDAGLVEGDAARLPFADDTFDAGLASYVVSAAPAPVRVLEEMQRVCRSGGTLVLLNHFSSSRPLLAAIERAVSPVTARLLGFHAHFPLEPIVRRAGLAVECEERVPPLWYWQVVRCVVDGTEASR